MKSGSAPMGGEHTRRWPYVMAGMALMLFLQIASATLVLLDAFFIEPNWVVVETLRIREGPLAEALSGLRAVLLSDLHLVGPPRYRERRAVDLANGLDPDLVFVTGDVANRTEALEPLFRLLARIEARRGRWIVYGNNDWPLRRHQHGEARLRETGFRLLDDTAERLPDGWTQAPVWIAGVTPARDFRPGLRRSLRQVPEAAPVLLLSHYPWIVERVPPSVALVLSGHTHGGQVGLESLRERSRYANRTPYVAGAYRFGPTLLYVNRGIGLSTLPVRFFCRPEVTHLLFGPS